MISGDELSKAMAKFATGVILITTSEEDGSVLAMTANAITSISLEPALVLVCVAHTRNTFRYIRQSGRYAINVLNADQLELARHFARSDRDREFQEVPVDYGFSGRGTPWVEGCLCTLDCEVVAMHDYGDHAVIVGEVHEAYMNAGKPLLFYERRLLGLESKSEAT